MLSREKVDDAAILPLKAKGSPSLPPPALGLQAHVTMPGHFMWVLGFNCDPYASKTRTLLTGLASQLPFYCHRVSRLAINTSQWEGEGEEGKEAEKTGKALGLEAKPDHRTAAMRQQ